MFDVAHLRWTLRTPTPIFTGRSPSPQVLSDLGALGLSARTGQAPLILLFQEGATIETSTVALWLQIRLTGLRPNAADGLAEAVVEAAATMGRDGHSRTPCSA